jgi:hypothetical protein
MSSYVLGRVCLGPQGIGELVTLNLACGCGIVLGVLFAILENLEIIDNRTKMWATFPTRHSKTPCIASIYSIPCPKALHPPRLHQT